MGILILYPYPTPPSKINKGIIIQKNKKVELEAIKLAEIILEVLISVCRDENFKQNNTAGISIMKVRNNVIKKEKTNDIGSSISCS